MSAQEPALVGPAVRSGYYQMLGGFIHQEASGTTIESWSWRHVFPDGTTVSGRTIRRTPLPAYRFTGFQPAQEIH